MHKSLYQQQFGKCGLCGATLNNNYLDRDQCQVAHLYPVAKGGSNEEENLVLAHQFCNQEKKDKTLLDYFQFRADSGLPKSTFYSTKIAKGLKMRSIIQ